MTNEQVRLIRESWAKVRPIAPAAAGLFYDRLFAIEPSVRRLFRGGMVEQGRMLMAMIGTVVARLDDLDTLVPAVAALGARHAGYGVRDEHYAPVGEALLWTLEQGLGDAFTPALREAWATAYGILAETMRRAAHDAELPAAA